MPARKSATKKYSTKSAGKKSSKSGATSARSATAGALPPYGVPIREALASGDPQQMKKVAASARKYVSDVQAALDKLNAALDKKS